MALLGFLERIVIGVPGVGLSAVEEYVGAERTKDRCDSAYVVAMWMRKQNCIDAMDAFPDEKRHDDLLADRFCDRCAVAGLAALETSAGVDHDRVSARRLDENPVALPDVDERDAEIVSRWSRGPQYERTRERRDRERCNFESHASLSRQITARQSAEF